MTMLRNRLLLAEVAVLERLRSAGTRARRELDRVARGEGGQTPTEYLMIVGLMAAVIVLVFVTFYWQQVKTAAQSWVAKVESAILGTNIQ